MQRAGWRHDPDNPSIDVAEAIFFRKGSAEPVTNKRRPPARLCPQLLRLVRLWARSDEEAGHDLVIHDRAGNPFDAQHWFEALRIDSGLGPEVSIHVLRHTCATWLLEGGATIEDAADYLGLSVGELERTYGQIDPAFTSNAADALNDWGRGSAARPSRPRSRSRQGRAPDCGRAGAAR